MSKFTQKELDLLIEHLVELQQAFNLFKGKVMEIFPCIRDLDQACVDLESNIEFVKFVLDNTPISMLEYRKVDNFDVLGDK